ncbi:TPA: MAE_28990/MAE_18760 family HEPN-like nuclease [Vibrio parahaemolyticus]
MLSVKADFSERFEESTVFLNYIKSGVSDNSIRVLEGSMLKSAYLLLLYNIVESTITSTLDAVHARATNIDYNGASKKIRRLIIDFHFNTNKKCSMRQLDEFLSGEHKLPLYSEFSKRVKLYSGNLDAREIDQILSRYGIGKLSVPSKANLLIVKNQRNRIAHGEVMFKEACRHYTIQDLEIISKGVFDTLNEVIMMTEQYLQYNRYRA